MFLYSRGLQGGEPGINSFSPKPGAKKEREKERVRFSIVKRGKKNIIYY